MMVHYAIGEATLSGMLTKKSTANKLNYQKQAQENLPDY